MDFLACEYPLSVVFWFSFLKAEYVLQVLLCYPIYSLKNSFNSCPEKSPQEFPSFHEGAWGRPFVSVSLFFSCVILLTHMQQALLTTFFLNTEVLFAFLMYRAATSVLLPCFIFLNKLSIVVLYPTNILSCGGNLKFTQLCSVVLGSLYRRMMHLQSCFIVLVFHFML